MPDMITEHKMRQGFWRNVICSGYHKRLVAKNPDLDKKDYDNLDELNIFVPQTPYDDFNLVLSLTTSGSHWLTLDWDMDAKIAPGVVRNLVRQKVGRAVKVVTPSTSNWHVWGNWEIDWETHVQALFRADNDSYYQRNWKKGFCALRPPWITKDGVPFEASHSGRMAALVLPAHEDLFVGMNWSGIENIPGPEVSDGGVTDDGVTLDELFGEDE